MKGANNVLTEFFLEPRIESGTGLGWRWAGCWAWLAWGWRATVLGWAGLGWAGLLAGLGSLGVGVKLSREGLLTLARWLGWAGLGWAGLGWAGLGWLGLGWAMLLTWLGFRF